MATLTGTKIANTYKQLLQVGSSNTGLTGSVQTVQDGQGNNSPLQLSQSAVNIDGTFQLSGVTLTANASTLNAVADLTGATGIVAVSAGNVYGRTITGGTGVSITNGDGTEGNPTIALNTTGVVSGTYGPLTTLEINEVGQIVSATAVSTSVSVPTIRASEFIGGTFKGTTADFSSDTSIGGTAVVEGAATFNSTVSVSGALTGSSATFTGTVSAGNISGANATFSGNVSATEYYGDGSNLTGIVAASATFAASAGFAASATNASFALSATNANFAASASFASSASYAASAGEASFAVSASSAAFATSADSATFAVSAANATTAYNVSGGVADISGLTAVSASISDLRAFQIGATSVSIGYLNVNDITAITISATDLKSSTLSFTSVSVSSLRVYRLAVETTLSATYGTFTGDVSAVSFYGDGSNLTGILVSVPTSVPSYTVNQLSVVSAASFPDDATLNFGTGNDLQIVHNGSNSVIKETGTGSLFVQSNEIKLTNTGSFSMLTLADGQDADFPYGIQVSGTVSATSFVGPTITSINSVISNVSALTSVNAAAITSINTILGDGSNFATSAELAATSAALATSIATANTRITSVSDYAVALSATLATSIGNSNTNITTNTNAITSINTVIAGVSALTSVNAAAITSINTVVDNLDFATSAELATVSAALATSISNSNTNITTNANAITSINTVINNLDFATSAELAATSAALATSISNHLPLSGGTLTGTVSGTDASFSGNVSAVSFYGDGSNLTNLPTAPTSVSAYTVNQLTIVSAATLAGTDLETRINTVSVNTSVNAAAITSINAIIEGDVSADSGTFNTLTVITSASVGGTLNVGGNVSIGGDLTAGDSTFDALKVTTTFGTITGASTGYIDDASGNMRVVSLGPNTSLNGTITFSSRRSDASNATDLLTLGGSTGNATFTGDVNLSAASGTIDLANAGNRGIYYDGTLVNVFSTVAGGDVQLDATDQVRFKTASTERMRIDSSGNLLVGSTNTDGFDGTSGLKVASSTAGFLLERTGTRSWLQYIDSSGDWRLYDSTDNADRMVVDSSGNVGIGTTSPAVKLHVSSGASNEVARFEGTNTPYISIYDTGVRQSYWISSTSIILRAENSKDLDIGTLNPNAFRFTTNNTERMRIDSSGNVGIGTSSPSAKLDVNGTLSASGLASVGDLTLTAGNPEILTDDNSTFLYISGSTTKDLGGNIILVPDSHPSVPNDIIFRSDATNVMRWDDSASTFDLLGNALSAGNIISTSSDTTDQVIIENTDDTSTSAPDIVLYKNSASPASSDNLGLIQFRGKDSAAADANYASILSQIDTPTNGAEVGRLAFFVMSGGVETQTLTLDDGNATFAGNVGIGGAASASYALQISEDSGSGAVPGILLNNTNSTPYDDWAIYTHANTLYFYNTTDAVNALSFDANYAATFVGDGTFSRSAVGGTVGLTIQNSATSGASAARLHLDVSDSSTADPYVWWSTDSTNVYAGIDNDDSDKFKIGNSFSTPFVAFEKTTNNATFAGTLSAGAGTFTGLDVDGNVEQHTATPTINYRLTGTGNVNVSQVVTTLSSNAASWDIRTMPSGGGGPFVSLYAAYSEVKLRTENTDALTIDSSQNVGIGKSPSYARLEVSDGAGTTPPETQSASTVALFQHNATSTDDAHISIIAGTSGQSRIYFGDANDENAGQIEYDHGSNYMSFRTNSSGEDMRITSSGSVGIGESSPSYKLHVRGDAAIQSGNVSLVVGANGGSTALSDTTQKIARIGTPHYTNSEEPIAVLMNVSDPSENILSIGGNTVSMNASTRIGFFTAGNTTTLSGSERMRIDSTGNVGIGTTSFSSGLTVSKEGSNTTDGAYFLVDSGNASLGGNAVGAGFKYAAAVGNAFIPFKITANGTTINQISSTGAMYVGNGSTAYGSHDPYYTFTHDTNTGMDWAAADTLTFKTGGTERVRIDSSGNVGIGTTSPAKQLHITKAAKADIGTLTDGATITPDFDANQNFSVTLGGNRTLANPSNIDAGQTGSIFVVQDGTGSRTLSFGSYWKFAGGTAPTLSTAAGSVDRIDYIVYTTTAIHAVATLNVS